MAGEGISEAEVDGHSEFRVAVRLSHAEVSLLIIEAIRQEVTPGELLRRAYFESRMDP